jgi:hypothetical protein
MFFPEHSVLMGNPLTRHISEHIQTRKSARRQTKLLSFSFPSPWSLFRRTVKLRNSKETALLREAYMATERDAFMETIQTLIDTYPQIVQQHGHDPFYKHFRCHHIVPLSLGGTNEHLAYIEPETHNTIHRFINLQTNGLGVGDTAQILIPYFPSVIWGRTPKISVQNITPISDQTQTEKQRPTRHPRQISTHQHPEP